MSQWYAIRCTADRERRLIAILADKGFTTFAPHETVRRKIGREVVLHSRPLFPGYLFLLCSPGDIDVIRKVAGVIDFVRYRDAGEAIPFVFPLAAIIEMQTDERAGRYDRSRGKPNAYQPRKGDKVQITAGPYMQYVAKVLSTPTGRKAKLLIEGPFPPRKKTLDVAHLKAA